MKEKLEKLNRFTRREHTEEEVYLFSVILCDNDIDRDTERFSEEALAELQKRFIGKTGIFDHNPTSCGQTARIYDTEIVREPGRMTVDGRPYTALKAYAYMIRTDANADLIREIEGGIKKEVSVSCAAARQLCSVCGADRRQTACSHVPGQTYGDKTCHVILDEIQDVYEWSFVAVPAQVQAGVTKFYQGENTMHSDKTDQTQAALLAEVEKQMRAEVMQLCAREKSGAVSKALQMASEKLGLQELMTFKQALLAEQTGRAQVQLLGETEDAQLDGYCYR
ncbi:MAG: hypothetical protein E7511_00340 [Ruminococcus sp.]|nr:hypothetical protein [Ruminococcus sp.]